MLGKIRWHYVPRLCLSEDFAHALDATSNQSRAYLLPVNAKAEFRTRQEAKGYVRNR